ncbi:MAG: DUF1993 family protein, partial [Cyanobacteria bacterium J06554_3]
KGLGFLTSFAMPNFFFHMNTAYNLLRQKGVPIGKREYLGAIDMNMSWLMVVAEHMKGTNRKSSHCI